MSTIHTRRGQTQIQCSVGQALPEPGVRVDNPRALRFTRHTLAQYPRGGAAVGQVLPDVKQCHAELVSASEHCFPRPSRVLAAQAGPREGFFPIPTLFTRERVSCSPSPLRVLAAQAGPREGFFPIPTLFTRERVGCSPSPWREKVGEAQMRGHSRSLRPWREKVAESRMRGVPVGQALPDNAPKGHLSLFTRPSSSRSVLMRDIGASHGIIPGHAGFTLIEILVVVLIIGILGAIMLPQYQRAVLKSRFAALMPIAKSMADSNEAYYLEHGEYADNAEDLPIQGRRNYSDGTELEFGTLTGYSYVLATRENNFPNNYIVYQKHSENFPGNIHCEALEGNDQAQQVCLSLGGQLVENSSLHDDYLTYILQGNKSDGKFPTSFSKLLAACNRNENCNVVEDGDNTTLQECEGDLTGTNLKTCTSTTYDADGNQTGYEQTQQQCNQSITYHPMVITAPSVVNSVENQTACIQRTYDAQNNQTGYQATYCNTGNNGDMHECNGTLDTYDEEGYIISQQWKGSVGTWGMPNIAYYTYDENGNAMQAITVVCATLKADGTCETYDTRGSRVIDYTDTAASEYGSVKLCATFNEDGTCATYSEKHSSDGGYGTTSALMCSAANKNINIYTGECL